MCDRCNSLRKNWVPQLKDNFPQQRFHLPDGYRNKIEVNIFWIREPASQSELSPRVKICHQKELFRLKLGHTPNTSEIIQPETRCAPFSSSSPSWSFDQGPEPQNLQSKIPSVRRNNTSSCRHSETCIVSICLLCGTDHPSRLPEPDTAHYKTDHGPGEASS